MLYRAAKQRFDEEDDFKTRAREAVTELQGGRPEYLQVGGWVGVAGRTWLYESWLLPLDPGPWLALQTTHLLLALILPCPCLPACLPARLPACRPGSASATPAASSSRRSTTAWGCSWRVSGMGWGGVCGGGWCSWLSGTGAAGEVVWLGVLP